MNWFDLVIVLVILGAGLLGFKIGLTGTAFLFAALFLGTLVGARVAVLPISAMEKLISNPDVRELVVFTAVFLPVFFFVIIIGSVVTKSMQSKPLKWIDCLIGAVLGLLVGVVFMQLVIIYLTKYPTSSSEGWLSGSRLVSFMKDIIAPIIRDMLERKSEMIVVKWVKICVGSVAS
jgi:membrane protein required for colicin V production